MNKIAAVIIVVVASSASYAQNTNVTHPLLTLEAIRLIEKQDEISNKYQELYRSAEIDFTGQAYKKITLYPYYWGVWNTETWHKDRDQRLYYDFTASEADEKADNEYQSLFAANPMNVMSGVVGEDTPFTKVVNHFYHAYSAKPLTLGVVPIGVDSKQRALTFLIESANIFGYEAYADSTQFNPDEWVNLASYPNNETAPFAKMLAFQSFGEALHHVEDMSSIAHVQNDSHLDKFLPFEKDDYEGRYLPEKIFHMHDDAFASAQTTKPIPNWFKDTRNNKVPATVTGVNDIWPAAANTMQWDSNSLAHKVYNASVFKGKLELPGIDSFSDIFSETSAGEGELKEMFGARLKFNRFAFESFSYWTIEGVGDWHYIELLAADAWWPASEFGGPKSDDSGNDYFYIEQKLGDKYSNEENDSESTKDGLVYVNKLRRSLLEEYVDQNSLRVGGSVKLVEKLAEELIPIAIEYAAGFSQYWYDHVNSPPYLKSIAVRQKTLDVKLPDATSVTDGYWFTAYQARWQNIVSTLMTSIDVDLQTEDDPFFETGNDQALFTAKRKLKKERLTQPLHNDRDIDLILSFSEAIKSPADASSGFKLELHTLTKNKTTQQEETVKIIELSKDKLTFTGNSADILESDLKYKRSDPDKVEKHMKGSVWKVTIPADIIKNEKIEGAVRLVVYAEDKNNHRIKDSSDATKTLGQQLDAKPNTPARVYAKLESGEPVYRWHTQTSFVPTSTFMPEYIDSKDEKGNSLPANAFAYDYKNGDSNHILWFSPSIESNQQNTETTKNYDAVSITTLPEKDITLPR